MDLKKYVEELKKIAREARTESKLEVESTAVLRKCLNASGVDFDPAINESLKSLGLSQVDADRPDGVFGHIVYDYKEPDLLKSNAQLKKAEAQIERYLDIITGGHSEAPQQCSLWFAYLFDGYTLVFCRSNGVDWVWTDRTPLSENSLNFLLHAYSSLKRKPLTAPLLSSAFGKNSDAARKTIRILCEHLSHPKHKTNMLYREWRRLFEQVSTYELDELESLKKWTDEVSIVEEDASHILFAMHTYYSFVVKLLTSELLSAPLNGESLCYTISTAASDDAIFEVLSELENSEHYKRLRISNFLEGDFFSWYLVERSTGLAEAIRNVANELLDFEPATAYLLPGSIKDLLKAFYSSLIDEQIRHDLGEYYTPDWLAQHLLNRVGYAGDIQQKVLDPTCGSGTFLIECIVRLKGKCVEAGKTPLETLMTIVDNIKGIDLNPLAVISARANYILSIADLVFELGHDIEIPIYLADSVNVPTERDDFSGNAYLEYNLDTELKQFLIRLPSSLVHAQVLGRILLLCEDCITHNKSFQGFREVLQNDNAISMHLDESVLAYLEDFYSVIETLENKDWDRIWCRILKNNFSPHGFPVFDFIIGNPPWVRWSRLPETYRNRVRAFCKYYGLVSGRGYSGGIESDISTVITYSAADHWLADGGRVAFIITWTVFKTGSARGFRLSELPDGTGLKMLEIADMTSLQPFADATNETAIYIAEKVGKAKNAIRSKIPCRIWNATGRNTRIPPYLSLAEVSQVTSITEGAACPVADWGSPLFTGDKQHFASASVLKGNSDYVNVAHRGTVTDCARVYWVKLLKYSAETNRALIRTLTKNELARAREVAPVKGVWIEADLLYPLIRGRGVGKYSFETEGWYQIIPNNHYEDVAGESSFAVKYPLAYSYFKRYEDVLRNRATYKRYQVHLPFYVIYCVGDYSFDPYKVVWMEQQNPSAFRATVISKTPDAQTANTLIVPDHKLYFASFKLAAEAHYVCGFLNSRPARTWLGGFLLGKQIGTTVFEFMKLPPFSPDSADALEISSISKSAHKSRRGGKDRTELEGSAERKLENAVVRLCRT